MGDIGDGQKEYEFEPIELPTEAPPVEGPAPEVPVVEPELVPA